MINEYKVTVWHFEEECDTPKRRFFSGMIETSGKKLSKNGIKQKGFYIGDEMSVRIFTDEEIGITPGDYICKGECWDEMPKSLVSQKIVEVRDLRQGAKPHWRILCGG